jgi:succinyl-CoA synthetase alpha subunit
MTILVDKRSRVITQGLTSEVGQLHTAACRGYGSGRKCFLAGVDAQMAGESLDGLAVFGSVRQAKAETGATVSVIYAPAALAAAAIEEAIDAELALVVCVTEDVPSHDMIRVRRRLQDSRTLLLGPGCPGVVTPGHIRIGALPGHGRSPGRIGVVSRSGLLACEAADQLAAFGLAASTVVGFGEPTGGHEHIEVLRMFDKDPGTDAVLMIGHIGSDAQDSCARWVADHCTKPVVAFVDGDGAPRRLALMQECGIKTTRDPAAMGELLASVVDPQWLPFD